MQAAEFVFPRKTTEIWCVLPKSGG